MTNFGELSSVSSRRVQARTVEGVYLPHRLIAQQMFPGVAAAAAASRARDDNNLLACGMRDEVLREYFSTYFHRSAGCVRLAQTIGAHSVVDGSREGGLRGHGEDEVVRKPLGRVLVRVPECAQDGVADVRRLETGASRRGQEEGRTRAECAKAQKLTCRLRLWKMSSSSSSSSRLRWSVF